MIFRNFKRFRATNEILDFMLNHYNTLIQDLNVGLARLAFDQNFQAQYAVDVEILAGAEKKIAHDLGLVPTGNIIVRQSGDTRIIDGDTDWDDTAIYLKNVGANTAIIKVLIFK